MREKYSSYKDVDSACPEQSPPPTPTDVFSIADAVVNSLNILESDTGQITESKCSEPNLIIKKLIFDTIIYYYFKEKVKNADGFGVLRSHKFLFIRFLGLFFFFFLFLSLNFRIILIPSDVKLRR